MYEHVRKDRANYSSLCGVKFYDELILLLSADKGFQINLLGIMQPSAPALLFCNHQKEKEPQIMKLKMITEGLNKLLLENHYNPSTVCIYEREWKKLRVFLMGEYGDTKYEMERGLKYL